MLRSWKIGKVFGIPLYVHSTFLLLPAIGLYQSQGAGWATTVVIQVLLVAMFGCVVLHEFGHIFMARYFGIGTRDVTLYPIGGVARLERMSEEPVQEVAIALAGPAVNLVIVAVLTPFLILFSLKWFVSINPDSAWEAGFGPVLALFVLQLWLLNFAMMLFNLIPAFPLDGGRVLRALLALGLGHLRATEVAARVSMLLAIPIAALSLTPVGGPMALVVAAFIIFVGQLELAALRRMNAMRQRPVYDVIPADGASTNASPATPRVADATGTMRESSFSGYLWDTQLKAWVLWRNGRPVAAFGGHSE